MTVTAEQLGALHDTAKELLKQMTGTVPTPGDKLWWEAVTCLEASLYHLFGAYGALALREGEVPT